MATDKPNLLMIMWYDQKLPLVNLSWDCVVSCCLQGQEWTLNRTHLRNKGKVKQTMRNIYRYYLTQVWCLFILHPGVIFPISNLVHLSFPNPFCLHLTECSAVLYCDSMAHQRELPPFQLHGPVLKCYAPTQRQMFRFYSSRGIW